MSPRRLAINLRTFRLLGEEEIDSAREALPRFGDLPSRWERSADPEWMLDALQLATNAGMIYQDLDRPLRRFAVSCAKDIAGCRTEDGRILSAVENYAFARGTWGKVVRMRAGFMAAAGGAAVSGVSRGLPGAAGFIAGIMPAHEDPFEAARLTIQWSLRMKEMKARERKRPSRTDVPIETVRESAAGALRRYVSNPFTTEPELNAPWFPRPLQNDNPWWSPPATPRKPKPEKPPRRERRERPEYEIRCPFCPSAHTPDSIIDCGHVIGEGDPEIEMIWHLPILRELFDLAMTASDLEIDIGQRARGVKGWEKLSLFDQEDQLTGTPEFLRDVPGIRWREMDWESIGPMSGIHYWIFAAPRSREKIEREFRRLRERLTAAIAAAEASVRPPGS